MVQHRREVSAHCIDYHAWAALMNPIHEPPEVRSVIAAHERRYGAIVRRDPQKPRQCDNDCRREGHAALLPAPTQSVHDGDCSDRGDRLRANQKQQASPGAE